MVVEEDGDDDDLRRIGNERRPAYVVWLISMRRVWPLTPCLPESHQLGFAPNEVSQANKMGVFCHPRGGLQRY